MKWTNRELMIAGVRWIGLAFIVTLLLSCGETQTKPAQPEVVQGLLLQKIQWKSVPDELQAPGTVIASATAQVAARTMGTVLLVAVKEGDAVHRGQLLAQLDERELAAHRSAAQAGAQAADAGINQAQKAMAAAQAQADVMQKTYDRYTYLQQQKSVSPQEFDEIRAKQQAAQAQLEQARAVLAQAQAGREQAGAEARAAESVASYARIVAPFDGRVLRRMVDPGSLVSPGAPLFVVEDTSRYQLQATLPTGALLFVNKGSLVRVELDLREEPTGSESCQCDNSMEGKVVEIETGADPASHTLNARIDLPHDVTVKSGVFGRAYFAHGEKQALMVPPQALVTRGQLRGIYAVDANGLVHWRVVTLGQSTSGQVEVLSGIAPGDVIVLNPGVQQLDGKKAPQVSATREEKHS
ncbi:MAG TPA: efflux RND transporter periplasmic adaptor subunit [Candidatus Sulfotelmatobacter sp.]|nr:efflux RND transporter periplasmic adaptor subunit [Candidatus Sulfotelmatobacter sp.]